MNILYIILSCQDFLTTRCQWIKDTWMTKINKDDNYLILSSKNDPSNNVIGYDTGDEYKHASDKYSKFFEEYEVEDKINWLFFVDDDTYVNTDILKKNISLYNEDEVICREIWVGPEVASRGVHKDNGKVLFPINCPSGGSGFAVSRKNFYILKKYIKKDLHCKCFNSDVSFGFWCRDNNIKLINREDIFRSQNPDHPESIGVLKPATWHYCGEEHFKKIFKNDL